MSARMIVMALLLVNAVTAASAELGRLFFTPAQRNTLDVARAKNVRAEISNENPPPPPPAAVPQNVHINGMVRRSDGPGTVWINNRPVTSDQAAGLGVTPARNDNRVRLSAPEGRSVELKVGQTAEMLSGTVEEGYARRNIPKPDANVAPAAKPVVAEDRDSAPSLAAPPPASNYPAQQRDTRTDAPGSPRSSDAPPNK